MDYTIGSGVCHKKSMNITTKTRFEIIDLIKNGYNRGFVLDGEGNQIVWELTTKIYK